ncbi:MAG: hypothetical protein J6V88_02550 [Kiritimatiellae bacterium]|nr:hypothetical protein [Kiritimatiellia bacterium]
MYSGIKMLSDHELWILLKEQDADAWSFIWEYAVLAETNSFRNSQKVGKWNIDKYELFGMLYEEMIHKDKINLYRDDGGSVLGWFRTYIRGYINRMNPSKTKEILLGAGGISDEANSDDMSFEEKISIQMSDSSFSTSSPKEDPSQKKREEWEIVQKCFGDLWKKNPMRAYVHLLKLRMNLSSTEIKVMLGISSEANVDQMFSRAVKDMKELKVKYESNK